MSQELNETNELESLPSFSATDIIITSHGKQYNQGEPSELDGQQQQYYLKQQQLLSRQSENSFCNGLLQFLAEQDTTTAIIKKKIQQQIKPPRDTSHKIATKPALDCNISRIQVPVDSHDHHIYDDKENQSNMDNKVGQYQQQQLSQSQQYDAKTTIAIKNFYLDLQRQMKPPNRSQQQPEQIVNSQPSKLLEQDLKYISQQQGQSSKLTDQQKTHNLNSNINSQLLSNRNDDFLWIVNRLRNIKEQIQEVQEIIHQKRQQLVIQSTHDHNANHDSTQIDKLAASVTFLVGKHAQAQADLKSLEQETKNHQESCVQEYPNNQEIQLNQEGREKHSQRQKITYHNDGIVNSYSPFSFQQSSQDKYSQEQNITKLNHDRSKEFVSSSSIGQQYQPVTDRVSQILKEQMQQQISNSNEKQQILEKEQEQQQLQQSQNQSQPQQFQLCSPKTQIFSQSANNNPNQCISGLSSSANYHSSCSSSHCGNTMNSTHNNNTKKNNNNNSSNELSCSSSSRLQTTASNQSDRNPIRSMGIPVTTSAFSIQAKAQNYQSTIKSSSSIPRMRSEKSFNNSSNNRSITQKIVQQQHQGYLNIGLVSQRDLPRQLSVKELQNKDNCQRQTRSMSYQEKYALLKAQAQEQIAKGKRQQ